MRNAQGIAIVAALAVIVVVAIMVLGTSFTSLIDRSISANQRGAIDAYYVAKAGADKYKTAAFQTYRYYLANKDKYKTLIQSSNPACGNYLSIGLDLNRDGVIDSKDIRDGQTIGPFKEGAGEYTITFQVAGRYIVLTSRATVGRSRSTVQVVAEPSNAGLFDQALFSGPGQSAKFLNGNVQIRGGIYIEGDPTNPNKLVIDSNGNFGVFNYYSQNDLRDMVSNASVSVDDLKTFLNLNFLEQKDMCAHVRVKDGKISLSGSATLGGPASTSVPSGFKTNLEGVEVGQNGQGDISGVSRVHADIIRAFDLGQVPKFPRLDDSSLPLDSSCAGSSTWRACLHTHPQRFVIDSIGNFSYYYQGPSGPAKSGNQATVPAEFINRCQTKLKALIASKDVVPGDTRPAMPTLSLPKTPPASITDNRIDCRLQVDTTLSGEPVYVGFDFLWNVAAKKKGQTVTVGELAIYGVNNLRGLDLEVAQDVQVRFAEKATIFVEGLKSDGTIHTATPNYTTMLGGYVFVEGDILPQGCLQKIDPCPASSKITFPDDSVLGIIADHTFHLTGVAQSGTIKEQIAMGLFYAGYRSRIEQGGIVFGSVLAPEFTFTSAGGGGGAGQTSKLIYVPGLTYGSAPGFSQISDPPNPAFNITSVERR